MIVTGVDCLDVPRIQRGRSNFSLDDVRWVGHGSMGGYPLIERCTFHRVYQSFSIDDVVFTSILKFRCFFTCLFLCMVLVLLRY